MVTGPGSLEIGLVLGLGVACGGGGDGDAGAGAGGGSSAAGGSAGTWATGGMGGSAGSAGSVGTGANWAGLPAGSGVRGVERSARRHLPHDRGKLRAHRSHRAPGLAVVTGRLEIANNAALASLEGLDQLVDGGELTIRQNPASEHSVHATFGSVTRSTCNTSSENAMISWRHASDGRDSMRILAHAARPPSKTVLSSALM
jgi:hypothetical protein